MSQGWSYVLAGRVGLRSISSHARSLENANPFQNADKDLSQEFTKQQGQFQTETELAEQNSQDLVDHVIVF